MGQSLPEGRTVVHQSSNGRVFGRHPEEITRFVPLGVADMADFAVDDHPSVPQSPPRDGGKAVLAKDYARNPMLRGMLHGLAKD